MEGASKILTIVMSKIHGTDLKSPLKGKRTGEQLRNSYIRCSIGIVTWMQKPS